MIYWKQTAISGNPYCAYLIHIIYLGVGSKGHGFLNFNTNFVTDRVCNMTYLLLFFEQTINVMY